MIHSIDGKTIQECWHLTDPNSMLLHNVFLGKGCTRTVSSVVEQVGPGFVSRYQVSNRQPEKEAVWERVRVEQAPNVPSRLGSTYLFETEADADRAIASWYSGQSKIKVRVLAFPPSISKLYRADSKWLNRPQAEWENAARSYWRGVMSADPMVELLAHGKLFFPGWERPPFGLMGASSPENQAT